MSWRDDGNGGKLSITLAVVVWTMYALIVLYDRVRGRQ